MTAEVDAIPGGGRLAPDDIPRLDCADLQVLREALRLCPPAATGTREGRTGTSGSERLPSEGRDDDGGRAHGGATRPAQLWDDPLTFDPDRFSPERFKELDRWQYLPFGGGPRVVHRRSLRNARGQRSPLRQPCDASR